MNENILGSIRHATGLGDEHVFFDPDLVMHINSVFDILHQLGIGPSGGFKLETGEELWSEFLGDSETLEMVKTYMYISVKLVFDPPQNSFLVKQLEDTKKEYEWRMNVGAESKLWKRG